MPGSSSLAPAMQGEAFMKTSRASRPYFLEEGEGIFVSRSATAKESAAPGKEGSSATALRKEGRESAGRPLR